MLARSQLAHTHASSHVHMQACIAHHAPLHPRNLLETCSRCSETPPLPHRVVGLAQHSSCRRRPARRTGMPSLASDHLPYPNVIGIGPSLCPNQPRMRSPRAKNPPIVKRNPRCFRLDVCASCARAAEANFGSFLLHPSSRLPASPVFEASCIAIHLEHLVSLPLTSLGEYLTVLTTASLR